MEECFLANTVTFTKPNGGTFTPRETDVISCIINGGTEKSIGRLLSISHHTAGNYIGNIRGALNFVSKEQIIEYVQKSSHYRQINERYVDLLLFNEFEETLKKIKSLNISPKHTCVIHSKVEDIDKYILLKYLKSANIKVDILYNSKEYAEDEFYIICCSESCNVDWKNLDDNIVISENHCNNIITLTGKCIASGESGTQYKAYFGLLACISKIYSSKNVDAILDEFKEYYYNIKDRRLHTNLEQHHIEITDRRKNKYVTLFFISFSILLMISATTYWHNSIHKTVLTNINMLVGEDIFLKRKDLILKMDKILEKQKRVRFLVLVGQGGIGKTTFARHYMYKNNAKIKWEINASTEENTIKSFLELAIELSQKQHKERGELQYIQAIEEPITKKNRIISFVFSQLKTNKEWCLLFDNIDDFKVIRAFIPSNKDLCGEGTIIITTRNTNCENMNFISNNNILNIEYLEKSEKKKLFWSILYGEKIKLSKKQNDEVDKFLENIPPMPLDISNAAYYVKNTNASFKKYLEIVRSPNEEIDVFHSKFVDEGVDHKKTRYRMTTAAFDKLIEANPNFKELLLFICLLDSKNIPRKYLDQYKDFLVVTNFICNLKRFFSINLNNGMFSIHKSIQEIGLIHLNTLLSSAEKEVFLRKIINIMTPYSAILWQRYKTYSHKLSGSDLDELKVHVKAIISNLEASSLLISEGNKYITRLLLVIGFIYGEDNFYQEKYFLKQALKLNGKNEYIENYEYALALLSLGYAHLTLDELDDAKSWLDKELEFCKDLRDAEILKACGLCDLGRYYAKTSEFDMAITLLEKALSIVDNKKEHWARDTASKVYFGLSHTYADHYINKLEGNKAVFYAQKSFKKPELEDKIEDIKKSAVGSEVVSRWCLVKAYNRIGEHNKAQKCAHRYYHLHEKYYKNEDNILSKSLIDIEYGYTLLRKGELDSALNILNRAISQKQELKDNYYMFHATVSRTEALIRLNRLDEAYSDFKYALQEKGNSTDNYTRLLLCVCYYHAFIIKYKQKDYKLALEHFADFCISIEKFCKGFLDESKYNKLKNANVFKIIEDESQIKRCLHNSAEIFSAIYGNDHPFVKEYIIKSLN